MLTSRSSTAAVRHFVLQTIESKFSEFQLNVESGAERVTAVNDTASRLIDAQNPNSAIILEKQEQIRYPLVTFSPALETCGAS